MVVFDGVGNGALETAEGGAHQGSAEMRVVARGGGEGEGAETEHFGDCFRDEDGRTEDKLGVLFSLYTRCGTMHDDDQLGAFHVVGVMVGVIVKRGVMSWVHHSGVWVRRAALTPVSAHATGTFGQWEVISSACALSSKILIPFFHSPKAGSPKSIKSHHPRM